MPISCSTGFGCYFSSDVTSYRPPPTRAPFSQPQPLTLCHEANLLGEDTALRGSKDVTHFIKNISLAHWFLFTGSVSPFASHKIERFLNENKKIVSLWGKGGCQD